MTRHHNIERRFGERERERLAALFRRLGTDNVHEAEAARGRIDALLRQFGKAWSDLIGLLGGTAAAIRADLVRDIVALGSSDPDERVKARRNITDLLARHRKNWNDLADVLCTSSFVSWASHAAADDPKRVNPLDLVHYLLEQYVALKPHEYIAVSLWALHTHLYNRFMVTPRLALRSPTADSGKTTLIDILARLTAQADKFDSITSAAIYHLIDDTHPTLLIDEADNLGLALQPAHGRKDDVGGIAGAAFEIAAAEATFGIQVSDDGAQLALDDTEDAALLAGDEDATGFCTLWPRYPLST